jgi:hypothetical protein
MRNPRPFFVYQAGRFVCVVYTHTIEQARRLIAAHIVDAVVVAAVRDGSRR